MTVCIDQEERDWNLELTKYEDHKEFQNSSLWAEIQSWTLITAQYGENKDSVKIIV